MKKNKTIAAVLFGILAIAQFFGLSYVLASTTAQMPALLYIEIAALFVYVFACVKMFKTAETAVTGGEKRAAAALSVLYLVAVAINIQIIIQVLMLSFAMVNQDLAQKQATGIVFLCVRTALLIGAMYFTISNEKQAVAVIEFDGGVEASELSTEEAVETITEKLDAAEQ